MRKTLIFLSLLAFMSCSKPSAPVSLTWELEMNDMENRTCTTYLTIHNLTDAPLEDNWTIYFDLLSVKPVFAEGDPLLEKSICASFHSLTPTSSYVAIPAHDSVRYMLVYKGYIQKESYGPEGPYIVFNKNGKECKPQTISIHCLPFTMEDRWIAGQREDIADIEDFDPQEIRILPSPKQVMYEVMPKDVAEEMLKTMPNEGYIIICDNATPTILANSEAGQFYAEQTLARIRENLSMSGANIPTYTIVDYPDYSYRGMMLDITRNFTKKENILHVIDYLSAYKMNTLHLHLSDDEGWRIEIPGIPELTRIGSHRGHTLDEKDCLYPLYCGGWDANDKSSSANGYLTRKDFIEILRYAKAHHVQVIPEIDVPGHSRAAIVCMRDCPEYCLFDTARVRETNSAQNYAANVLSVWLPTVYTFIDKVVGEIVKMYEEADAPIQIFHIGGDEVAKGALTHEEKDQFLHEVINILAKYNLTAGGWEEFCIRNGEFNSAVLDTTNTTQPIVSYCWRNSANAANVLNEAGMPIVLCRADYLYIDMIYWFDCHEKGLHWAGAAVDEYRTFEYEPLTTPNVVGMQAQIWAETIRSFEQVQEYMFPRILGVVERSWNANQDAILLGNSAAPIEVYRQQLRQYEMPRITSWGAKLHHTYAPKK